MPTPPAAAPTHRIAFTLFVTLVLVARAGGASALPLFARASGAPCSRCHTAVPVLNATGERFLAAGDREPGQPARALAAGDPLPLAVTFEAGAYGTSADTLDAHGARGRRVGGAFRQHALDLHLAAVAGERVAVRVTAGVDSAESAVRARTAYVRLGGTGNGFALRAGTFDGGLPFLSTDRRPTRREYLAPVEISAHGVEVTGTRAAWAATIGMMNSSRTGASAGGHGFNRLEDTYARVTRAFGAQELGARLLFDRQDSDISFHAWLQRLQAQVGGRFGADRLWIVPAYTLDRFDDRPSPGIHQRHQYALLEALAVLGAEREWVLTARAEHEHTTPTISTPGEDQDLEALRLTRVVSADSRVALEWSRVAVTAGGPRESRLDALMQLAY